MFFGLEDTQRSVSEQLETLFDENKFPNSMLFTGPSCSGKMYAALCCAKKFNSDQDSTIIISDRTHKYRIKTALKLFEKNRNKASKEFLIDTVSVFLKQYHGALLESLSSTNKKKFSDAGTCSEILDEIKTCQENEILALNTKLDKAISPLVDQNKTSSISVSQVRAIRDWARETNIDDKPKFVIIEGLENSTDSASNALLKILEEPPENTIFILLSTNPGRIPSTILSRVRKFVFNPLTNTEKAFVLNKIFVNPNQYEDLDSFFIEYSGVNDSLLKENAWLLVNKEELQLKELVDELESNGAWDRFFYLVTKELREKSITSNDTRRYEFLLNEINQIVSKGKTFNQTKRLTFDFVIYRTNEVLK